MPDSKYMSSSDILTSSLLSCPEEELVRSLHPPSNDRLVSLDFPSLARYGSAQRIQYGTLVVILCIVA